MDIDELADFVERGTATFGEDAPDEDSKSHSVYAPHNSEGPKPRAQLRIRPRM